MEQPPVYRPMRDQCDSLFKSLGERQNKVETKLDKIVDALARVETSVSNNKAYTKAEKESNTANQGRADARLLAAISALAGIISGVIVALFSQFS